MPPHILLAVDKGAHHTSRMCCITLNQEKRERTCLLSITQRHGKPGTHREGGVGEMREEVLLPGDQVG